MDVFFDWIWWLNTFWDKVSADLKKGFDSKPVYYKEYLKTKIKSHDDEITDFYHKEIPKVDSNHTCLAVIRFDFVLKKDEIYYPQVFLKECKHIKKKVIRHIHGNIRICCCFFRRGGFFCFSSSGLKGGPSSSLIFY